MLRLAIVALSLNLAGGAYAQPPGGRVAPLVSPEVAADGKVTFRLRAPNAKEVFVAGIVPGTGPEGGRLNMQKDEQGVWSVTTGPMQPGIYQ